MQIGNLVSIIGKLVPNPLSSKSSLQELEQKKEVLKEGISIFKAVKQSVVEGIGLLILAIVAVTGFELPVLQVGLLVLIQMISNIVILTMKIKQIKAIRAMNTQETPQIYKEILIQKERYEFYQSVFSVISNVIMLCLIVIFFGNKIIEMAPKEMFTLYIKTSFWWYIAIALIGLRMYSGFLRYRRYQKVKSMTGIDFVETNKQYQLIYKAYEMWQGLPIGPVFIGVLILLGTPWYMPLAAIVIFASMVALSLQEYKRIAGAAVVLPIKHIEVPRYPGEHIVVSIFGVMKTGTISTASLGVGQAANPENSLLLTNERMLWIQVPVSGAGMVIGDMDYTVQNMLFNRSELRQKGTEMLAKNTIEQILSEHIIRSLPYTMINSVEIKSYSILVACTDGTSLEYLIIDRDYLSTLQQSLKDIFKERYKESS